MAAAPPLTVAAAAADPKSFAARLRLLLDDEGAGDPVAIETLLRVGEAALEAAAAKDKAVEWLSGAEGALAAAAFVAESSLVDATTGAGLAFGALASSESGTASAALWRLGLPDAAVTVLERAAKAAARAARFLNDGGGEAKKKKEATTEEEDTRDARRQRRRRSSSGIYATAAFFSLGDDDDDDDDGGGEGDNGDHSSPPPPGTATTLAAASALRSLVARDPRRASAAAATGVAGSLAELILHYPSSSGLVVAAAALLSDLADALTPPSAEKGEAGGEEGSPKERRRKRKRNRGGGGLPLPAAKAAALLRPAASLLEDEACEGGDPEAERALWGLLASAAERVVEEQGEGEGEGGGEEEASALARSFADERGVDLARLAESRARALRASQRATTTPASSSLSPATLRLLGLPRRAALALAAAASADSLARRALEGAARGVE